MRVIFVLVLAAVAASFFGPAGFIGAGLVGFMYLRLDSMDRRLKQVETELRGLSAAQPPLETATETVMATSSAGPEPGPREPLPAPEELPEQWPPTPVAPLLHWQRAAESARPAEPPAWQASLDRRLADFKIPERGDLEQLIAGRGLAIAGGAALIMGAIFFLGLAFSRGWIGPELRVIIGLGAGAAIFALGAWLLRRERAIVAHVLVAVGLGVLSLSLFAATRLYGFVSPEVGVGGALAIAVVTAGLAIAFRSQLIAGFGLVAVLGSPPIMGASASLLTLLFLGAALVGTTAIAVYRRWTWLSPLAFVLAAPQLAAFIVDASDVLVALSAVATFWALNAAAAAGAEWIEGRESRRGGFVTPTVAGLLVLNGAFATWGGLQLLVGDLAQWRGLFLLALAAGNGMVAAPFLARRGLTNLFGMVAAGSGIAVLTLAVPIQLGSTWVPMAWAAEAVALTAVYARRNHLPAGISAAILGALAVGHLVVVHYPLGLLVTAPGGAFPFWNASGAALGVVLLAMAAAGWLARSATIRVPVAAVAGLLIIAAAAHELTSIPFAALLGLVGAGAVLVQRRVLQLRLMHPDVSRRDPAALAGRTLYLTAAVAAVNLLAMPLTILAPADRLADGLRGVLALPEIPFVTETAAVVGIGVLSAIAIALTIDGRVWRQASVLIGAIGIAYLLPTQVAPGWAVVGWLVLAVGLHLVGLRLSLAWLKVGALVGVGAAVVETLAVVAPPTRLVVRVHPFDEAMILNQGVLAVAALAAAFALRAWLPPRDVQARWSRLAAAVALVYVLSVATVDVFQSQLSGGRIGLEELQKQGQVALSVLWAVVGLAALVLGLARNYADARIGGLGLLGIVTVKVFVVDLAALDVAYRVLSFVALGVLLLAAAYLYRRMEHHGPMAPHPRG